MSHKAAMLRTAIVTGLVSGLLSTVASPAILAAEIDLETNIKAVKIYRNRGALVTRTAMLEAAQGNHTVTVRGLPSDIDEDYGLRARFVDNNGKITQIKLDEQFTEASNAAAQQRIISEIRTLEQATRSDQSKIEALNIQLRFIEAMGQRTSDNALDKSDIDNAFAALEKTLSFVATNSGKIINDRSTLEDAIEKRQRKINALQQELVQTGKIQKSFNEAVLSLSKEAAPNSEIELSYLINEANWTLEAEAELDSAALTTTVNMFAVVEQNSGEDWTNVPLSLSTTQISTNINAATPYPVYYNLVDPQKRNVQYAPQPKAMTDSLQERVVVTGSRIVQSNFDAEFALNAPVSIASGSTEQRFHVASNTSNTKLHIRTTPTYGTDAFLYAEAEFTDIPALSNPNVSIIRDGHFVGRGAWPDLSANKKLQLPFGSYERVEVKTVTLPSEDGKSGIFNKRRVDEEKQQFIVTNNHTAPLTIEVYGNIPQSLNEDIEVESLRGATNPSEANIEDRPGVVVWRKTLDAGEVWTINHWLRTSYPADMRLVGK